MKMDARALFAGFALLLGSCQGNGFDSGMGDMTPPVSQPGSMSQGGMPGANGMNGMGNQMAGPNVGPNGQEELTNPGATLAPNEAQYPIGQGPTGMKCPQVHQFDQQFNCTLSFNMPAPSASASPGAKGTAAPTASPTPSPSPTPSSDDDDNSDDDATPTPSPAGMMTLQVEPLPKDVPNMNNPNPLFMKVTPVLAIRLQSNTDFVLNGGASTQYVLPPLQYQGRVFALQLFNETVMRGKRMDQLIASYQKFTTPTSNTVQFAFNVPKVTVRHTQIWLLALYGAQLPPGTTPTPSPTPSPSASPSSSP